VANPAVVVDFLANTRQLQRAVDDAEKRTKGFGGKLKSLAKTGAFAAGAAGLGAVAATLKIGIGEYSEAAKVGAQTNAVIKSTGEEAHVSAKHVSDLAGQILKKSGIDDEAVQSGENLLLTFTNVRNEVGKGNNVFDQATGIMADMSTALGQDMKTSALQLGKALNNPIKGMGALKRVGVSFTEAQATQVKALQDSGKTMEAQKIILKELSKEFGGSAEAAGKTLPGQLNIAKETFNNFAGLLVGKMIPVLQDVIAWLRDHWPEIQRSIEDMWRAVKPILVNLGDLFKQVVKIVQDNWPIIGPIVNTVATVVKNAAVIIGAALKLVVDLLKGDWGAAWDDAKKIVSTALNSIKTIISTEINVILAVATKLGKAILDGVENGIEGVVTAVETRINNIKAAITGAAGAALTAATNLGRQILNGLIAGVGDVVADIRGRINGVWGWSADFLASVFEAGKTLGGKLVGGLKGAFDGLAGALRSLVGGAINTVLGLWNNLRIPGFHIHIKIPGPIPDIDFGWGGLDLPNIPLLKLAEGGIVTRPTVAMVGERGPEAVIPLTGHTGAPVEVRVFIGETELLGMIRTEVLTENNRVAQTLLAGLV
jgi:hypothetical protein